MAYCGRVNSMSKKLAVVVGLVVVILVGLGAIVYAVAERYSSAQVSIAAVTTTTSPEAAGSAAGNTPSYGSTTTSYTSVDNGGTEYTASDTSYKSATTSISITKVSTGSGEDALTYFVADVKLTSGTYLQAGLADGFKSGNADYTSAIAKANNAILAINGDYFTARDTGVIIRNGVVYLDVPTRAGLAIYKDGTMKVYDETQISSEQLLADGVWNTYSFGPAVLVDGVIADNLDTTEVADIGEQHTILGTQPRTGVGIIDTNHFVFIVVDGRSPGYSMGVTLSEFAQIFKDLGCTTAYNLDGGGSSAMYFRGALVNNPLGDGKERGISDILYVE
jgi:exopolysaccharide biosynthesis protein